MIRIRRSARVAEWVGKRAALLVLALSLVLAAGVAQAASAPVDTVSPGGIDRMTLVRGTAPTFSWGSVTGAESYEVLVYELSDSGRESEAPSLSVSLPGSASSWTPDARLGLEAGHDYVWFVRAVTGGKAAALSRGRMFAISGAPSLAEVDAAMNVLRRYSMAGEADETEALAAPAPAEFIEPTPAPSLPAPTIAAPVQEPEQENSANPIGGEIPGPLAPVPLRDLGISATAATTNDLGGGDAIAIRGAYESTDSPDIVVGYLGVAASDTTGGEFDGFAALKALDKDEMGVLGFNSRDSSDNFGVVGVSVGRGGAGRFYNTNTAGTTTTNPVLLGTTAFAVDATGPVRWDCPSDMDRAGTWCIDKVVNAPAVCGTAVTTCHNEGKTLCSLEAIMTCDFLDIRNSTANSCGDRTDDPVTTVTRTFGLDTDATTTPFDQFINWRGNNSTTESTCGTSLRYFCCRPVSP